MSRQDVWKVLILFFVLPRPAAFAAAQKLVNRGKQNLVAVLTGGNISDGVFGEIIHGVIRE